MDWFIEEPRRGQNALIILTFVITAGILWFGRRRKVLAVPIALVFWLLSAVMIPSVIPARLAAQRNSCVNNLRIIQGAKEEWARINQKLTNDVATETDLVGPMKHIPVCPRGGAYAYGSIAEKPTCSLSHKGHKME